MPAAPLLPGVHDRATLSAVKTDPIPIVVLEGDETGQELLEQALSVLERAAVGFAPRLERFDLSLAERRRTGNDVVREAAAALRRCGLGLKAATVTPPGADDVGSPNRILREEIGARVIVRTARSIPGVPAVAGVRCPITVVRMAVGDAYGADERRDGEQGSPGEVALRTERIRRADCRAVAEHAFRTAAGTGACVYGGPKWTVSAVYEGMFKEELDAAATRHPGVAYRPLLIDATYAGLVATAADNELVIPALNRDGDCLSDLVLPLYGSIAGAESLVIAFGSDPGGEATVVMAEAPHGTAPDLEGRDLANPMAMILALAALLLRAGDSAARRAGRAIRAATMQCAAEGIRTLDLGGSAGTSTVTHAVGERVAQALAEPAAGDVAAS